MASQAPDTKAFYGYLFKSDKTPTETLDALLRAIAQYIVWSPVFWGGLGRGKHGQFATN